MADIHTPVLAALRAAVDRLGDHQAPDDTSLPYGIFYCPSEATPGGPVSDPFADRDLVVQVTAVGAGRLDCLRYLDNCRAVIVNLGMRLSDDVALLQPPTPILRRMVQRADQVHPPVFTWIEQWRLLTTPVVFIPGEFLTTEAGDPLITEAGDQLVYA